MSIKEVQDDIHRDAKLFREVFRIPEDELLSVFEVSEGNQQVYQLLTKEVEADES